MNNYIATLNTLRSMEKDQLVELFLDLQGDDANNLAKIVDVYEALTDAMIITIKAKKVVKL